MNSSTSVVEREREYHNQRFAEETRVAQEKYYFALRACDARYEQLVVDHSRDAVALDYGCAKGDWALRIAPSAKTVHGVDISDVAIDAARADAAAQGLGNAHFATMDAHNMEFEDGTFDLVFGHGIIHHLDTRQSLQEVSRVLKPGGVAVFCEPLGYNPIINLYRAATPGARTIDEHPLVQADRDIAGELFRGNDWEFHALTSLASVPFRNSSFGERLYDWTTKLDRALFRLPVMRWQAWSALMVLTK